MTTRQSAFGIRRSRKGVSALQIAACVGFLWLTGARSTTLLRLRETYRLTSAAPLDNAPPLVAFTTVALGGFRGLLADMLWLRVSHLQDAGNYFELVQLSDWITKLEPRCTAIWAYHAWNMTYNVSVMLPDFNDRWRWVRNGLELLRDKGLAYNPGSPRLYCELGWIFQHKIGAAIDEAHLFYKKEWSREMSDLLGGARPDYKALAGDKEQTRRLREEYGLLPTIMHRIDAEYGPLDWRCPETHAAYWAYRGKMQAPGGIFLPADRMIFQSLAAAFKYGGRPYWIEDTGGAAPDPSLLPSVIRAYRTALELYDDRTVRASYSSFLRSAARLLAKSGHGPAAREAYALWLKETPPPDPPAGFEEFLEMGSAVQPRNT